MGLVSKCIYSRLSIYLKNFKVFNFCNKKCGMNGKKINLRSSRHFLVSNLNFLQFRFKRNIYIYIYKQVYIVNICPYIYKYIYIYMNIHTSICACVQYVA